MKQFTKVGFFLRLVAHLSITMLRSALCFFSIAIVLPLAAKDPAAPEGFTAIFNGKDLSGWSGSDKYWSVETATSPASPMANWTTTASSPGKTGR